MYEYKVISWGRHDTTDIAAWINTEAARGWRLVAVVNMHNAYGEQRYFFERKVAPKI